MRPEVTWIRASDDAEYIPLPVTPLRVALLKGGCHACPGCHVHRVASLLSDQAASTLLIRLGQVVVYTLAVILYFNAIPQLHSVGTALLASAGVASILFGLAAQTTLSNLVSGFALLFYQPFEVGDRVQLSAPTGLETGVIDEMTMGYILVKTVDDRHIVVPNSVAAQQIVVKLRAA